MSNLHSRADGLAKAYMYAYTAATKISPRKAALATIAIATLVAALIGGMIIEQQRLWPRKYFIKAQTALLKKELTRTSYPARVDVWKDVPVTQPVVMVGDSQTELGDWPEFLKVTAISNRGISKDTTEGLLKRIDASSGHDGVVFLMIGTNDADQGVKADDTISRYRQIVKALNDRGNKVYAQSILFAGAGSALNAKVARLNTEIAKLCGEADNCEYVDLNAKMCPDGILPKDLTNDGVHPNAQGYRVWASVIQNRVDDAVTASRTGA